MQKKNGILDDEKSKSLSDEDGKRMQQENRFEQFFSSSDFDGNFVEMARWTLALFCIFVFESIPTFAIFDENIVLN